MTTNQRIIAIIKCTQAVTDVPFEDMMSATRERHVSDARKIVFYLVDKHLRVTKKYAGQIMQRDYSTAIANVRQANNLIATDPKFASLVEEVERNYTALFFHNKISTK